MIPKGFFPQEDTSLIEGQTDAPQDIGYPEMVRRMHLLTDVLEHDPDMAGYVTFVGGAGRSTAPTCSEGCCRAMSARTAPTPIKSSRACAGRFAKVPGATMYLQSRQDITRRRPAVKYAVSVHAAGHQPR